MSTLADASALRRLRRARISVAMLFVVFGVVDATWSSRIPLIRERLALSPFQLSVALAGPAVGLMCAALVTPRLATRLGSRRVARGAVLACSAGLVLPALAGNLASLFAALTLWGACLGAVDITMNTQAAAVEQRAGRSLMSGLHASYSVAVLVVAPIGSLAAAASISPRVHFTAMAVVALVASVAGTRWLVGDVVAGPQAAAVPVVAPGGPSFAAVAFLGFCGFLAEGAVLNWSGVLLHRADHASLAVAPLALTGFSVGMVLGRGTGDWFIERWGHDVVAWRAAAVAAAGMAGAAAAHAAAIAIAGYGVLGIGLSVLVPISFTLAARSSATSPVTAISRLTVASYAALFVGPPVIGVLSTAIGLRGALLCVAALLVTVALVAARLRGGTSAS